MQKLLDAGAIVFGKANLHELAYGITNNNAGFGAARNPYDPTRIPGGSSGGVGVAVGARIVPGGIGSDTGGSVRIPAALCGIVGFRPTTGRWSQAGIVPISHTRDTRRADDAQRRRLRPARQRRHRQRRAPAAASLKGLRLGVPRGHFWSPLDAETARLMEAVLARLKDAGAVLVEADVADVAPAGQRGRAFRSPSTRRSSTSNAYLAGHGSPLRYAELVAQCASPDVAGLLQSLLGDGGDSRGGLPACARGAPAAAAGCLRRSLPQRHDVAAIVFPTTPLPAAPIGDDETVMLNGQRVPTFFTFIRNSQPGQRRRHPRHQPAGGDDRGRPAARHRARRGRQARCAPAGLARRSRRCCRMPSRGC